MSTYKVRRVHISRSGLSIALSSACLLALCILLGQGTEASSFSRNEPTGGGSVLTAPLIQANGAYTQYMPLIQRNYGALINGDFEQGLLGWETGLGPFRGFGSGLPVGVVSLSSGQSALLGSVNATNEASPVGYGTLYQSFIVHDRDLQFRYWVYSYDVAYSNGRYRDTFEVAINRSAAHVSDTERNARGCSGAALNPQGVFVSLYPFGYTRERTKPESMVLSLLSMALMGQEIGVDYGYVAESMLRVGFTSIHSRTLSTFMMPMELDIARK